MRLPVEIDLCKPDEREFVQSSYVQSTAQHYRRHMPSEALYPWLRHRLRSILETSTLLVANDEGTAVGWILAERRGDCFVVTGLYVKHLYRRMDVAKQLLAAAQQIVGGQELCYDLPAFKKGREWADRLGARRL